MYITPEEYKIAERNGISNKTLEDRIRRQNWDRERALTKPTRSYANRISAEHIFYMRKNRR